MLSEVGGRRSEVGGRMIGGRMTEVGDHISDLRFRISDVYPSAVCSNEHSERL